MANFVKGRFAVTKIYASPLNRAKKTATHLADASDLSEHIRGI